MMMFSFLNFDQKYLPVYIPNQSTCQISLQTNNFELLNQSYPKRVFPVKTEDVDTTIKVNIFELDQVRNFGINNFIFWTKFIQKVYLPFKIEKVQITIKFCTFELVLVPKFTLNKPFRIFGPSFSKKVLSTLPRRISERPGLFFFLFLREL